MRNTAADIGNGHSERDDSGTSRRIGTLNGVARWIGQELAVSGVDRRCLAVEEGGRLSTIRLHRGEVGMTSSVRIRNFPPCKPDCIGPAQRGRNNKASEILDVDGDFVVLVI